MERDNGMKKKNALLGPGCECVYMRADGVYMSVWNGQSSIGLR